MRFVGVGDEFGNFAVDLALLGDVAVASARLLRRPGPQ